MQNISIHHSNKTHDNSMRKRRYEAFYKTDVKQYILNNIKQPLSPTNIAEYFDVDISTLKRKFKSVNGIDIKSFILSTKLHMAAVDILQGESNLNVLTQRYKFNSALNFVINFNKQFKTYPYDYERLWEQGKVGF